MKNSLILFLSVSLFLAGCAAARTDKVPIVKIGKDECAQCGMIISEARYASGYVDNKGETIAFDDLGELFETVKKDRAILVDAYVAEMENSKWLLAAEARYVKASGFATPMGSGIVAFANRNAADTFAKQHGTSSMNFEEMLNLLSKERENL